MEDFNLINFIPLDITNNERHVFRSSWDAELLNDYSVHNVLLSMDQATQYGEDRDFRTRDFDFM